MQGGSVAVRRSLEIHFARATADWKITHQLLKKEEYFLIAECEAGDRLGQFVTEHGAMVVT